MSTRHHDMDAAKRHMAAWFSQRPTFALMGEFSAGKSTLLNVLLGRPVLPAMITATKLPVIWLTYGKTPVCHGLTRDGQLWERDGLTPDPADWDQFIVVRMALDAPVLKHTDILDTPGISDPRLASGSLAFVSEFIDFSIWCTAANQAWRQSEKAAWLAMPKRLRDDGILAVTRADQLGSPDDIRKVVKRLRSDTPGLFRDICPVMSWQAMDAAKNGKIVHPDAWQASGAHALSLAIKTSIAIAEKACAKRETLDDPTPLVIADEDAGTQIVADTEVADAGLAPALAAFRTTVSEIEWPASQQAVLDAVNQLHDAILHEPTLDKAHADVLAQCLSVDVSRARDFPRVIKQVEQELEDFAKGPWCRLDETCSDSPDC